MTKTCHPAPGRAPRAARQRGVAAISLAVLAVGVAGAALGSFLLQRAQARQADVHEQWQAVQWADEAVQGFVLATGRLPCPASSPGGAEDCGGQRAKGWLPVASLRAAAGTPPTHRIRYLVNRDGDAGMRDLTLHRAAFQPRLPDGRTIEGYRTDIVSGLDLCWRLLEIQGRAQQGEANGSMTSLRWRIAADKPMIAGARVPVGDMAYGVAIAAHRAPDSASGINAVLDVMEFESPLRGKDLEYSDMVRVTTPAAYYEFLGCGPAMAALDAAAVAQAWIGDAAGNRDGNIEGGKRLRDIVAVGATGTGIFLVNSIAEATNAISTTTENIVKLKAAILKAIAGDASSASKVAIHIAGMVAGITGVALAVFDSVRIGVALGLDAAIGGLYNDLALKATLLPVWQGEWEMLECAHVLGIAPVVPTSGTECQP